MLTIKILTGSIRPTRFNLQPATWMFKLAKQRKDIKVELVDIQKINLPLMDEPVPPLQYQYSKPYTKKWAKIIAQADGFIFVTPEYNHSTSGAFKNAIDYLYHEWKYKPVSYLSYGSEAGGARAVEHLRGIAGEQRMYDLREQLLLPNYWDNLDEKGQYRFTDSDLKKANLMLDDTIFWAGVMKEAREKLSK